MTEMLKLQNYCQVFLDQIDNNLIKNIIRLLPLAEKSIVCRLVKFITLQHPKEEQNTLQ